MLMLSFVMLALAGPPPAPDVVVVCPLELQDALTPWLVYRANQGHHLALVDSAPRAESVRRSIRRAAPDGCKFIVLVGDAASREANHDPGAQRTVPTFVVASRVIRAIGGEPEIATDNPYADFDDDGAPDAAIGRIPVKNAADLTRYVERITQYENTLDMGPWRRRLNFVAGLAGFGAVTDFVLERATKNILTRGIPPAFVSSVTYAGPSSPYSPAPGEFHRTILERWNEGCWFWVYIGHGSSEGLDWARTIQGYERILGTQDVDSLASRSPAPIALFLACSTCHFDGPHDCLAESMLAAPGGPMVVIGGSRVTMPYGMSVLGEALLEKCFEGRSHTAGELFCLAKRSTAFDSRDDPRGRLLDGLAQALSPSKAPLHVERTEHLALFHLLGDPLTKLRLPREVRLTGPGNMQAGKSFEVTVQAPFAGQLEIELVARRDELTFQPPPRDTTKETPEALAEYRATYARANDPRWWHKSIDAKAGEHRIRVETPSDCQGPCHVRAYLQGKRDFGLGAMDLSVVGP